MKTEQNIFLAFLLNLTFSLFEFVGGIITGSTAILSDAVHDIGDAVSIGISLVLEKMSKRPPDETYTYGYARYSVLGGVITTLILLFGSVMVVCHAVLRIIHPVEINYDGMILFAVIGVCVNLSAVWFTRGDGSLNQRSVQLHMLEDVLGWAVVLAGALVMRFTGFALIDPILSIGTATFIFIHAVRHLGEALELLLEKTPRNIRVEEIKSRIADINGILDVHHLHIWSLDGFNNCATMHIVSNSDPHRIKEAVREELLALGIAHGTFELEAEGECCHGQNCPGTPAPASSHHHHH